MAWSVSRFSLKEVFGSKRSGSSLSAEKAGGSFCSVLSPSLHWQLCPEAIPNTVDAMRGYPLCRKSHRLCWEGAHCHLWIFLEDHMIGLTTLRFSPMFLCAVMIISPWCDDCIFSEANDASEKATNRTWCWHCTFEWSLASCGSLFPSIRSLIWTLFILLCKKLNRLPRSGRWQLRIEGFRWVPERLDVLPRWLVHLSGFSIFIDTNRISVFHLLGLIYRDGIVILLVDL